jgi:hypothetical protein
VAWWLAWAPAAGATTSLYSSVDVGIECALEGTTVCEHFEGDFTEDEAEVSHQVSTLSDAPGSHPLRDFPLVAEGTAQTRFGIHRAFGHSSAGGLLTIGSDDYDFSTYSDVDSIWTDVWTFDADGSLSASVDVNGSGSPVNSVPGYDSLLTPQHEVGYQFIVTDLADPSCFACVANIEYLREVPGGDFHDDWPLAFDYEAGHAYEVSAQLFVREENGWLLDFGSTAVLADLELTAGSVSAESGTDYFDLPVPEPAAPVLLLVGVALLAPLCEPGEGRCPS